MSEKAPHTTHNIEVTIDTSADGDIEVNHQPHDLPEVNENGEPFQESEQLKSLIGATALEHRDKAA